MTNRGVSVGDLTAFLGLDDTEFNRAIKDVHNRLRHTSSSLQSIGQEIGLAFGAAGAALGVVTLAKKIYTLGVAQEQINTSFRVFLGDVEKANKLIKQLTDFASITPFTSTDVSEAAKKLLAFGFAGEEVLPTIRMLGNISAGTGKNLAELAVIFGQIKSAGRLMGQDLLQLINAGFNPLTNIAERTGKSMAVLKKEMEKGLISFDMVEQAFRDVTSEGGLFFGMMDKQSQTVGGRMSTLQDNIENIGKGLFEANSGPLKDFITSLVEITNNVDGIVEGLQGWLKLVTIIPATTLKIATSMSEINNSIKSGEVGLMGFKGIQVDLNEKIRQAGEGFKQVNDTLEDTKQKFLAITIPTIEKLDTIAELEGKILEIKDQAKHATAGQLPLLGEQLRYYEKQKETLEGILTAERGRTLKPFVDTSITPLSDSNPFGTMIHGASQAADAYAKLILQIGNTKQAEADWIAHSRGAHAIQQDNLQKTMNMAMMFGDEMQNTIADAIQGQKTFAQVMASTASTVVDAIYAIITAKLFEKAISKSISIWDAMAGIGAASLAAGIVKGALSKSLQGLRSGGYVTEGGMFQLHKDEVVSLPAGSAVTPAHMVGGGGGGRLSTELNLRKLIIKLDEERARMRR